MRAEQAAASEMSSLPSANNPFSMRFSSPFEENPAHALAHALMPGPPLNRYVILHSIAG